MFSKKIQHMNGLIAYNKIELDEFPLHADFKILNKQ